MRSFRKEAKKGKPLKVWMGFCVFAFIRSEPASDERS